MDAGSNRIVEVPSFEEGGTLALGGTTEADLNVTYNYGKLFRFASLDGLTGAEAVKRIQIAARHVRVGHTYQRPVIQEYHIVSFCVIAPEYTVYDCRGCRPAQV